MQLEGALKVSLQDIQPVELWPGREPITLSMENAESFFLWKGGRGWHFFVRSYPTVPFPVP